MILQSAGPSSVRQFRTSTTIRPGNTGRQDFTVGGFANRSLNNGFVTLSGGTEAEKRVANQNFLFSTALGGRAQQLGLGPAGSSTFLRPEQLAQLVALRGARSSQERAAILSGGTIGGLGGAGFAAGRPVSGPGGFSAGGSGIFAPLAGIPGPVKLAALGLAVFLLLRR